MNEARKLLHEVSDYPTEVVKTKFGKVELMVFGQYGVSVRANWAEESKLPPIVVRKIPHNISLTVKEVDGNWETEFSTVGISRSNDFGTPATDNAKKVIRVEMAKVVADYAKKNPQHFVTADIESLRSKVDTLEQAYNRLKEELKEKGEELEAARKVLAKATK